MLFETHETKPVWFGFAFSHSSIMKLSFIFPNAMAGYLIKKSMVVWFLVLFLKKPHLQAKTNILTIEMKHPTILICFTEHQWKPSQLEKSCYSGGQIEIWECRCYLLLWILTSIELAMFKHSSIPGISSWIIRRSLHFIMMVPNEPTNLQQDMKKESLKNRIF